MYVATQFLAAARAGRDEVVERGFELLESPDDIEFCLEAGAMLECPTDAKWFLDRAVRLAPTDGNVKTRVALLLHAHGCRREAESLAEEANTFKPFELSSYLDHLFGMLARDKGATKEAVASFAAAFAARPDEPDNGFDYAIALANEQLIAEALAVVDTALKHCPGDDSLLELRQVLAAEVNASG